MEEPAPVPVELLSPAADCGIGDCPTLPTDVPAEILAAETVSEPLSEARPGPDVVLSFFSSAILHLLI